MRRAGGSICLSPGCAKRESTVTTPAEVMFDENLATCLPAYGRVRPRRFFAAAERAMDDCDRQSHAPGADDGALHIPRVFWRASNAAAGKTSRSPVKPVPKALKLWFVLRYWVSVKKMLPNSLA